MIGYYKSEDFRIFFLFPSSSSVFSRGQETKNLVGLFGWATWWKQTGDEKKQKKFTHSHHLHQLCQRRRVAPKFSSFFFFLFFRRHLVLTTIRVLDRQNKLSLTKMKRLFGVKKTVEAPSLEETTGKVIILSSFRLLLCLCLLFSFLVAHPSKLTHLRVQHHKTNWIDIFIFILFFSLILNK